MDAQASNLPAAVATLDSLVIELRDLPLTSLVPAGMLFLLGLLLLIAGKHLLRPVLAVAIVLASAMLGVPLLGPLFPNTHGLVVTLLGGILGAIVAAVAWRLFLGAALGVTLAFFCALLALLGANAGFIDARSVADAPPEAITLAEVADREQLIARSPELVKPLVSWASATWHAESRQVQVLLKAAALGGAFIGLVLGTWLSQGASALLTSLVGAQFALVGAMPFVLRALDRANDSVPPMAWMCLWLSLAGAGWLYQSWRGESANDRSAVDSAESRAENG
jgi:hypothetical protein